MPKRYAPRGQNASVSGGELLFKSGNERERSETAGFADCQNNMFEGKRVDVIDVATGV